MKNRYLLCLLLCAAMIYFAVPLLSPGAPGLKGVFAISWLVFVILVVAGNLSALLYAPKRNKVSDFQRHILKREAKRIRAR